jgi:hypothetical protein
MEKAPVVGCYDTWLNYLNGQPRGNVEIIIGCETEQIVEDLYEAVEEANTFIAGAEYGFAYKRVPQDPKDNTNKKVLHLVVE